jgi:hypothetical protein
LRFSMVLLSSDGGCEPRLGHILLGVPHNP